MVKKFSIALGCNEMLCLDNILNSDVGYVVINLYDIIGAHSTDMAKEFALNILAKYANPIVVYNNHGIWKKIPVDINVNPEKVGGTGYIPSHIDCVNATNPPDYVAFYCEREDPLGGGISILSNFLKAALEMQKEHQLELSQTFLREGAFFNLSNIGREYNPFPIIQYADNGTIKWVRYTGKRHDIESEVNMEILSEFKRLVEKNTKRIMLRTGSMLIVNQHIVGHGRMALGKGQNEINIDMRRCLWQMFYRSRY